MRITLKKFSYVARCSQETHCFSAVVCIDSRPVFIASNEGSGGSDRYDPLSSNEIDRTLMRDSLASIKAFCEQQPGVEFYGHTIKPSAESLICDAVNDLLRDKERVKFLRALSTSIQMVDRGNLYSLKYRGNPKITAEMIVGAKTKYPHAQILNTLTPEAAWDAACEHLGFAKRS